jgi:hypothetical protein
MARSIITYCRVSTKAQGRSGLGLEAQRQALGRFAASEDFDIVGGSSKWRPAKVPMHLTAAQSLLPRSQRPAAASAP